MVGAVFLTDILDHLLAAAFCKRKNTFRHDFINAFFVAKQTVPDFYRQGFFLHVRKDNIMKSKVALSIGIIVCKPFHPGKTLTQHIYFSFLQNKTVNHFIIFFLYCQHCQRIMSMFLFIFLFIFFKHCGIIDRKYYFMRLISYGIQQYS